MSGNLHDLQINRKSGERVNRHHRKARSVLVKENILTWTPLEHSFCEVLQADQQQHRSSSQQQKEPKAVEQ